ncbi:MAG: MlaD family protein [Verrucomicrobiota bacterium]
MKREFKFRYANEIAGAFVLLALILAVAGIIMTAHYRGWFEKRFEVRLVFETQQGSYGLKEGDEVRAGNTRAGSVKEIIPTEGGKLEAALEIKERFNPLVRKDSVARIKKKFVAAGDTYVEISRGKKQPVEDGDYIKVVRDQELMDRLQETLNKLEETALPMLDETREIMERVNGILTSVDTGKGLAGAVINDKELSDRASGIVRNMERMSYELTNTAHRIDMIMESVEGGEGIVGKLLNDNEMAEAGGEVVVTVLDAAEEAKRTLQESRRLIEGLQKHWLVRKYVEKGDEIQAVPTVYLKGHFERSAGDFRDKLEQARLRNDRKNIAEFSYKLAVHHYLQGNLKMALRLDREAAVEMDRLGAQTTWTELLRAAIWRRQGRDQEAVDALENILGELKGWSYDRKARLYVHTLLLSLYAENAREKRAARQADAVKSFVSREDLNELKAPAYNTLAIYYRKKNEPVRAAEYAIKASESLAILKNYQYMRKTLVAAAEMLADGGRNREAAHRYLQAARSYSAEGGNRAIAQSLLDQATEQARLSGSADLLDLAANFGGDTENIPEN